MEDECNLMQVCYYDLVLSLSGGHGLSLAGYGLKLQVKATISTSFNLRALLSWHVIRYFLESLACESVVAIAAILNANGYHGASDMRYTISFYRASGEALPLDGMKVNCDILEALHLKLVGLIG